MKKLQQMPIMPIEDILRFAKIGYHCYPIIEEMLPLQNGSEDK